MKRGGSSVDITVDGAVRGCGKLSLGTFKGTDNACLLGVTDRVLAWGFKEDVGEGGQLCTNVNCSPRGGACWTNPAGAITHMACLALRPQRVNGV